MAVRTFLICLALAAFAPPAAAQEIAVSDAIDAAVNRNPYRTPEQAARDRYRHPAQTLAFFGVTPEMTVVEPLPGWYTEIFAYLLRERGAYIAVNLPPRRETEEDSVDAAETDWRERFMTRYGSMFGGAAKAAFLLGEDGFAPAESADAILAFRSYHGWVYSNVLDVVLAEFYRALKPGGVLGIVQHREDEDSPRTPAARRGYLKESYVIERTRAAGFELVAKSEINANPADTKNYGIGVWALPPSLSVDDPETRRKHLRIGESDRMTLKFVKPAR